MRPPRFADARPLGRVPYVAGALLALATQHAFTAAVFAVARQPLTPDVVFWLLPLTRLATLEATAAWVLSLGFLLSIAVSSVLGWLTWRRVVARRGAYELVLLAFVPLLQLVAVPVAAFAPATAERAADPSTADRPGRAYAARLAEAVIAGATLTAVAVALSTLVLGSYGWGVFVLTPLLQGFVAGYLVNRGGLAPQGGTRIAVLLSAAFAAVSLVLLALEGAVCILMATPLALPFLALGATFGKDLARTRASSNVRVFGLAVLPLALFAETLLPPAYALSTERSLEIAAPPSAVWDTLVDMERIDPAPLPLFRAGLAYPTGGTITGQGVGARRVGRFSTGLAHERVTDWRPERRLAFDVISNPRMMDEVSPYRDATTPHAHGYFDTAWTAFELQPLAGGGTRLTLRAEHTLRVDPVLYWAPFAKWAIAANGDRVLRHIAADAARRD